MANRLVPTLRLAVLCSHVDFDANGLPFSLNEPIHTIQIPSGTTGAYRSLLALYCQLEDAIGTFRFSVQVRDENGFVVNPNEPPVTLVFPGAMNRVIPLEQVFDVDISFPRPSVYFVHLMCNHRSLNESTAPDECAFPAARVNVLS